MGNFGEIWIMQLEESEGAVKNVAEHVEFRESQYISWEGVNLPAEEWIAKAKNTLFLKKDGFNPKKVIVYPLANITPVIVGIAHKHTEYRLETTELSGGLKMLLLHVVLPDFYIPRNNSFSCLPSFIRKQKSRIALTWAFDNCVATTFQFRKVSPREFYEYKAVGIPDIQRIDPDTLRKVKNTSESMKILLQSWLEYKKYTA